MVCSACSRWWRRLRHAIGASDNRRADRFAGKGLVLAALLPVPVIATLIALPRLLAALGYDAVLAAEIGRFLGAIAWAVRASSARRVAEFPGRGLTQPDRDDRIDPLHSAERRLNWILIFGRFGAPARGIAGSAARQRSSNADVRQSCALRGG